MQTTKSSPQRRAADLAARDRAVMQEIQKGQDEREKKTARLRELRLAKEAADKETADKAATEQRLAAEKALKPRSTNKKASLRKEKPMVDSDL